MNRARIMSVGDALECAGALALSLHAEPVAVAETAGRVLAQDVRATRDLPALPNSAMDGFAVRAADTPGTLRVVGESAAGRPAAAGLRPGEAVAISTGGAMPAGADAVARWEVVRSGGSAIHLDSAVTQGRDVRLQGETIRAGEVLLAAGHRVRAHEVGALGAMGHATVACARRPRVAILATGAELVDLGRPLAPEQIHDASRPGLAAQVVAAGGVVVASTRVGDDLEATVGALAPLLSQADLVVTNGGISRGAHDLVRPALTRLGVRSVVDGIRAVPVHPTYLGTSEDVVVLGLPGNPASAAVAFHLLGRALLGHADEWWRRAPLTAAVAVRPGRAALVRCVEGPEGLTPRPDQGSHAVTSLAGATAVAWVGEDDEGCAGSVVPFSPLS